MEGANYIDIQNQLGERRTHQMMMEDISSRLQSKTDWYKYL